MSNKFNFPNISNNPKDKEYGNVILRTLVVLIIILTVVMFATSMATIGIAINRKNISQVEEKDTQEKLEKTFSKNVEFVDEQKKEAETKIENILEVVDTVKPEIKMAKKSLEIIEGDSINLLDGVTVTDNVDKDIEIKVEGQYNVNQPGEYSLKYVAMDKSGNKDEKDFTLKVNAKETTVAKVDKEIKDETKTEAKVETEKAVEVKSASVEKNNKTEKKATTSNKSTVEKKETVAKETSEPREAATSNKKETTKVASRKSTSDTGRSSNTETSRSSTAETSRQSTSNQEAKSTETKAPETTTPKKEEKKEEPKVETPKKNVTYVNARELITLVNATRKEEGLGNLAWSSTLESAAKIRAQEISEKFSHTRPDGSSFYTVNDAVYGENLGMGYSTANGVNKGWIKSPTHYRNMVNKKYKTMGAACCIVDGQYFWVELFGY